MKNISNPVLSRVEIAFAGCSWGGLIGAHLGVRHAERLRSLVLMNTPFLPSRGGHLVEFLGAKFAVKSQAVANGVAHSMLSPSTLQHPDLVERFTSPFASFEGNGAALTVDVTLRHSEGLESIMPALRVPTTIVLGQEDKLYPSEDMLPVATLTPNVKIVVVPNAGHIIPLEALDAAVAAIGRVWNLRFYTVISPHRRARCFASTDSVAQPLVSTDYKLIRSCSKSFLKEEILIPQGALHHKLLLACLCFGWMSIVDNQLAGA